ncbi:restriction endonuclease subunit S [Campylobacter concisus]|uniref:restriction endonuclease subunit S n=1 Tax=Campylobacter concisus TaxID=199 RepID=UPI000CD835AD|nr:restriction endonuclease subunit S [Campylobacter concisus]
MSEFKNLPSGWKVVRLGDVFEKSFYGTSKTTSINGKYPVLRMGNMQNGTLDLRDLVYIDLEENEFEKYRLHKGDILLNRTNSHSLVGKVSLFDLDGDYLTASYLVAFRPNLKVLNPTFSNNLLNTIRYQEKIRTIATKGVSQSNINPTSFKNIIKIPLPPLDEQKKIAEILSTWDEAINLTINLIESKKQFKKALMQNLLTAKIRFPQFKDEWQNEKLNKVTFFQEGPGVRNTQYKKEGIKLLNVGNLNNNTLNLNTTTTYISETEAYGAYKHFLIDDGDLLISCSGINSASFKNKIAFAEKKDLPLCLNTSTMRFKSLDDRLLLKYLYYFFQTIYFERQVLGVLTGSAQFNFGPTHIKWFKIKLPNLKEQQKIVEVLTACDDEINLLNLKLENLKRQKQGLMQKLLSGNIRTKVKGGKNVKMDD